MNILYAADNNYVPILAVSIASICKFNKNLHIVVIDNDINLENKKKLERIVHMEGSSISFFKGEKIEEMFPFHLNMDRGSMSQFARLFICEVLPDEWKRVLYLDCDTLIRNSLKELYEIDMKGMVAAGVEDAFGNLYWKSLGLEKGDVYINSGVILIDLVAWRKQYIEKQFRKLMVEKKGRIPQGDQGIINSVLKGKILKLSAYYNLVTYNFDFSYKEMTLYRKPYEFYSEEEIAKAKNDPVIVHFTSSFASMRPWENSNLKHNYENEWLSYYTNLGYTVKKTENKRSIKLYNHMPHSLALFMIGILHAYMKPIIYFI